MRTAGSPMRRMGLAIVADGVGGHGDGAWASQAATHWMSRFIRRVHRLRPPEYFEDPAVQERVIRHAIHFAHKRMVWGRDGKERQRRGSTIVGIWAPAGADAAATVFHVGDSRLYLLRQGRLLATYARSFRLRTMARERRDRHRAVEEIHPPGHGSVGPRGAEPSRPSCPRRWTRFFCARMALPGRSRTRISPPSSRARAIFRPVAKG